MQLRNVVLRGAVVLSGALFLAGCGQSDSVTASNAPATDNTASASASISAPAPTQAPETPERSSTAAAVKPPKGFGNAQGRVLFNEKPAANIKVTLCGNISFLGDCTGKTFTARTDKDGNYTIDKVVPGEYSLAVQVFDTNTFLYPTTGVLSAAKFKVDEGQTLDIRATNLFKVDLQVVSPKVGETVKSGKPKLTWKAYPNADNYEVTLSAPGNGIQTQTLKTSETSVEPDSALLNGDYQYEVVARNASGTKIASTRDAIKFKVAGQVGSARVELVAPRRDASVAGSGLKFSWKAHPLANGYEIYLAAVKGGPILSFEKVDGTEYALDKTLDAGTYYWSISATKDGQKVAASDLIPFRVK